MSMNSWFFITTDVAFQESSKLGARILATFMELDTPSQNNRIYRFVEGKKIARSLIGKAIRYGADWIGKHLEDVPEIGVVEKCWQKGKKIKGIVLIWDKGIVSQIKAGIKFLFSVGGFAKFGEVVRKGKRILTRLHNAVCTHLQLLPNNPKGAGFPTAKIHKILEINESFMMTETSLKVCGFDGKCRILEGIKGNFLDDSGKPQSPDEAIDQEIEDEIIEKSILIATKKVLN